MWPRPSTRIRPSPELASVGVTLQQMGAQVTSTFSELGSLDAKGELESAFKNADNCSSLVNSSG